MVKWSRPWQGLLDRRQERRHAGHRLLRAIGDELRDPYFVEVGAGDGITADHLHPFVVSGGWRGILLEPVPYVFERLRSTYAGNDRVILENAAIADHDGTMPFYYLREPAREAGVPEQYHLLGSSSRELLGAHDAIDDSESRIVDADVPCMTFASLCRKHGVERLDVLAIDAEGQDCAILADIDLEALRPRILVYEDVHVPAADREACEERLGELGYATMQEGFDTWAVDARPDDDLTRAWERLRDAGPAVSREELDRWFAVQG